MKQAKCTVKTGCGLLVFSHHGGAAVFLNTKIHLDISMFGLPAKSSAMNRKTAVRTGPRKFSSVYITILAQKGAGKKGGTAA